MLKETQYRRLKVSIYVIHVPKCYTGRIYKIIQFLKNYRNSRHSSSSINATYNISNQPVTNTFSQNKNSTNNMKLSFQTALTNFFSLKTSLVCIGKVHIHITYLRNRKKLLEFYRQTGNQIQRTLLLQFLIVLRIFIELCVFIQRAQY